MRSTIKKTAPWLALLAATASLTIQVSGASASTGGSPSAPEATTKVRASGIATWFGPGFYGKRTACGQTLTPTVVGVANRSLPCGTLVSVSYRGRELTVPVLDRGPYGHSGASWDLTAGAAQALDIGETARVATHVVGSTPNTPTLGLPAGAQSEALAGGAVAEAPVATG